MISIFTIIRCHQRVCGSERIFFMFEMTQSHSVGIQLLPITQAEKSHELRQGVE